MKNPYDTAQELAGKKLVQACETYRHFLEVPYEIDNMEGIAYTFEQTQINAHGNQPDDLCELMAIQARMLDGAFHKYLHEAYNGPPERKDQKIQAAIRMQNQMVKTMNAWKKLKTSTYIVRKLVKLYPAEKNTQNELNNHAALDR